MPRRTMTVSRIWYHPLRKTSVEDWGQVGELPDGRDLVEVFVNFAQSDIDNDSLVREDRESYAVVTGVERKNRAVVITTESGRFWRRSIHQRRSHPSTQRHVHAQRCHGRCHPWCSTGAEDRELRVGVL